MIGNTKISKIKLDCAESAKRVFNIMAEVKNSRERTKNFLLSILSEK